MEVEQLKLGKMTQKELATWFGVTYSTFKTNPKTKAKRMEILKYFADYHMKKATVYIDKIHIPTYTKAFDIVKLEFPKTWNESGLDTCARVGKEIYNKNIEVSSQVQLVTAQQYTRQVKKELYGRNHVEEHGTMGYSKYCWGKILEDGTCQELSDEELAIVRECSKEAYGQPLSDKAALLASAYESGEITAQEFDEGCVLTTEEKNMCYGNFISLLHHKLGFVPERLTKLVNDPHYFGKYEREDF